MKKTTYDKAVRDLIPDIIRSAGKVCSVEQVSNSEFLELLHKKLVEEVSEYLEEPSLEELADIMEVLMAVVQLSGYTMAELEAERVAKAKSRGGFENRLLLKFVLEE